MEKRQELYKGKAKTVYATDDPYHLVMHYRNDVSAFDGVKLAQLKLFQAKSTPCPGNIVFDVGSFAAELIWLHDEALHVGRHEVNANDINGGRQGQGQQQQAQSALGKCVDCRDNGGNQQRNADQVKRRQQIPGLGKSNSRKSLVIVPEVWETRKISTPRNKEKKDSQP